MPSKCAPDGCQVGGEESCAEGSCGAERVAEDGTDDPEQQDERPDDQGLGAQQQRGTATTDVGCRQRATPGRWDGAKLVSSLDPLSRRRGLSNAVSRSARKVITI